MEKPNDQNNSETLKPESDNDFENFKNALRQIFKLSPEEAKAIRDKNPEAGGTSENYEDAQKT